MKKLKSLNARPEAWAKINARAQKGRTEGKYPKTIPDVIDELAKHIDKIK